MKKYFFLFLFALGMFLSEMTLQQKVLASTPIPSPYPPFPTATAYVSAPSTSDTFVEEGSGFSIVIPKAIKATTSQPGSGDFQTYEIGNGEIFGYLFPESMQAGQSLEEVGTNARDFQTQGLEDIKYITGEQVILSSGVQSWYSRFQGYVTEYKYTVEVQLTTVIGGGRAVTLMFYSLPENYGAWNADMDRMRNSIKFTSPLVMGFPRNEVLILEGGENQNPRENDPATTHGFGDNLVFSGLVTYSEKLEIAPELAASWDISSDGRVYTFHLQGDAVFHNGRPFTAQDVVYSWERAANPSLESDTVMTYLSDIVGVKEVHEGQAESITGLKVIDDHTLQVTIDAAKPYFLYKLTYPTAFIVDRDNVESGGDWTRTPNATGPYRLVRWDSMEKKIYQRFDSYFGQKPLIPNVVFSLYSGDGIRLYESGSIDTTSVGSYNVPRVTDPSDPLNQELISGVDLCTSYIVFDVTQPPFDDVKVRQAFSMAFDKQKYNQVVLNNSQLTAKGLFPPALPGYSLDLKGLEYDPEKARELLAESKYGSAEGLPEITFTEGGYGSDINSSVAALIQMWQQNLGIKIKVENIEPEKVSDEIHRGNHGQLISNGGWCADYPDPENFIDVLFHSGSDMNSGNYENKELDMILEKARIEPEAGKRMELYQQAEQILVQDAPAIFLTHSISYTLIKPYVKGFILSPVSTFPGIRYLSLDGNYWK
ncbi:MAG: peptide ABC transporter substrate-binding protein [Chloroflexi bacterium]|nr:peptide ABC transporter substrate-binding protein [Chloroflexota bacterium]